MSNESDGRVSPDALTVRTTRFREAAQRKKHISSSRWLAIARFFAALPFMAALAVLVLAAVDTKPAQALDSEEQSFLTIINDYRAQNGLGELSLDPQLNDVARWMANDLATNDYFSHTDPLGRYSVLRTDQIGYAYHPWPGQHLVAVT